MSKFKMAANNTKSLSGNNNNHEAAEDDDDEVVSVDSCVGVLTRKPSSMISANLSGFGSFRQQASTASRNSSNMLAPPPSIINPKKIRQPLTSLSSSPGASPIQKQYQSPTPASSFHHSQNQGRSSTPPDFDL